MSDIGIPGWHSSSLAPAEQYFDAGEHSGSIPDLRFDADETLLAHQHGDCSWAEHDAHADSLAAVAATGAGGAATATDTMIDRADVGGIAGEGGGTGTTTIAGGRGADRGAGAPIGIGGGGGTRRCDLRDRCCRRFGTNTISNCCASNGYLLDASFQASADLVRNMQIRIPSY